jgi:hypothetical protein
MKNSAAHERDSRAGQQVSVPIRGNASL